MHGLFQVFLLGELSALIFLVLFILLLFLDANLFLLHFSLFGQPNLLGLASQFFTKNKKMLTR